MSEELSAFGSRRRLISVPKAADLVADDLRREIARGTFADGDELPVGTVLLERYGISRPTLREALRVLASENLISLSARTQGARVRRPSTDVAARYAGLLLQLRGTTLLDLEQARAVIEPPAARMLAERAAEPSVLVPLREALDAEASALTSGDEVAAARANAEFHDRVVFLSGNTTLHLTFSLIGSVLEQHSEMRLREEAQGADAAQNAENLRTAHRAHRKFLRLLEQADPDAAERHWLSHVEVMAEALVHQDDARRVVDLL